MKKNLIVLTISVLWLNISISQNENTAQKKFLFHLEKIERLTNPKITESYSTQELNNSVEVIESITNITSFSDYQIDGKITIPLSYNIKDW